MGTSRDYTGPPSWGPEKAHVTGAAGSGVLTPDKASALISAFVCQLSNSRSGGFGAAPESAGSSSTGGGAAGRGGGGRRGGGGSSRGVRSAAVALGGFIADVAKRGLTAALEALGLKSFEGKTATEIALALQEALCGPASLVEEEDLRAALAELMDELLTPDDLLQDIEAAFREAAANLRYVIQRLFSHYIFQRFCTAHYAGIMNTHGIQRAEAMCQGIKDYISEKMKLFAAGGDVAAIDWKGADGARVVDQILTEVVEVFSV